MSLDSHPYSSLISALLIKIAALHRVQLCRLAIITSGLDLKLLWGDCLCNMMQCF